VRQAHVLDYIEALLHHRLVAAKLQEQVVGLANVERALSLTVHGETGSLIYRERSATLSFQYQTV